jgi:hypothetical protein
VYTYAGDLTFDSINGTSIFGYNVTFSGYLNLNFASWGDKYVDDDGFYAGGSDALWSEEE